MSEWNNVNKWTPLWQYHRCDCNTDVQLAFITEQMCEVKFYCAEVPTQLSSIKKRGAHIQLKTLCGKLCVVGHSKFYFKIHYCTSIKTKRTPHSVLKKWKIDFWGSLVNLSDLCSFFLFCFFFCPLVVGWQFKKIIGFLTNDWGLTALKCTIMQFSLRAQTQHE